MRSMTALAAATAAAMAALAAAGCGPQAPRPEVSQLADDAVGLVRLQSWRNGVPTMRINLPPGYQERRTDGDGFDVHLWRRPSHAQPSDSSALGIYVGRRPRAIQGATQTEPGTVGGKPVVWQGSATSEDGRTQYQVETHVAGFFDAPTAPASARDLVIHIFIWGTDQDEVEALVKACETLRLEQPR